MLKKNLPLVAVFVVALAVGVYFITSSGQEDEMAAMPEKTETSVEATEPASQSGSGPIEMVLGDANAPITVIEYASYTCPHCASFHRETYKPLKENYVDTGKIQFIFREVYFDKYGLWASLIARCAGPDAFFPVTDMLLGSQMIWARAGDDLAVIGELKKLARVAGMADEKIEACLQDQDKVTSLVEWYKANAEADGVRSTPSFLINGTLYENMSYEAFSTLLDDKLGG